MGSNVPVMTTDVQTGPGNPHRVPCRFLFLVVAGCELQSSPGPNLPVQPILLKQLRSVARYYPNLSQCCPNFVGHYTSGAGYIRCHDGFHACHTWFHNLPTRPLAPTASPIPCPRCRWHVDQFLQWDWVGAPWSHYPPYTPLNFLPKTGGNGGLSIRTKSKTLALLTRKKWDGNPEDVWYGRHLAEVGGLVAGWKVADMFSVEGRWTIGSLGVHQPYLGGPGLSGPGRDPYQFKALVEEYCPEYKMIGRYGPPGARLTQQPSQPDPGPQPHPCT